MRDNKKITLRCGGVTGSSSTKNCLLVLTGGPRSAIDVELLTVIYQVRQNKVAP